MALQNDVSRSFRLYVTNVDGEGPFLKISGQLDKPSACMIESLIESSTENFDKGLGAVPPAAILEGIICVAKYKDGAYYRAKVVNTTNLSNGLVGVHFIDYGNKDTISLSTIRLLDKYDPLLLQLRGQATDYYLARIMYPAARWEEPLILKLQSLLLYSEYPTSIEAQTRHMPIVSIQFQGNDLSQHLVANKYGIALPVAKQEVLIMQLANESVSLPNWQPSFSPEVNMYSEHVPFFTNQNFPANPASAMRLQQDAMSYNVGFVPAPSAISQRLLVNKVSRAPVTLRAPSRQPKQAVSSVASTLPSTPPAQVPLPPTLSKPVSPKKSSKTYKSRLLEVNSQHKVFVSYAEEGPELFAVQLVTDARRLQDMMDEINRQPLHSIKEPPMIGTVCLGRMSGDRIICRAIVMNLSGTQCKLFFVDFGDTEMVSYYDIFDIPEEFVKPNVFAMRFCLSGVKNLEKGTQLNESFKQLVNGKVLTLRVVPPEGPPLIQYGELYLDSKNVLDMLMISAKETLQFKWMDTLPRGSRHSVLVSYVDSCIKFFVQLSDKIDELNAVMDAVKSHCEKTSSPGQLPIGAACCARFSDDGNWYRAKIKGTSGGNMIVAYVDYGNEQEVEMSHLRTITPDLIQLPAQALKCALKGFEDKPVETKTSNLLEMLALEKTFTAHIVGMMSENTMLVSLVDDLANPPLDVARRMTQLSQPRSNLESKTPTMSRKDAPEPVFSSPESSVPDDSRKKSFHREKSFKDERRGPREGSEDFSQRGGSFRGRENKDGFDRSGPGRHSEKFGGRSERPERGDRRGGSKPWENKEPISASEDTWEEVSPQPAFNTSPPNRQRDKRKPRSEQQFEKPGQKPGWRKNEGGINKRFNNVAADGSTESSSPHQKGSSVQDRLRRDDKFNKQVESEDNKAQNGWENNGGRQKDRRDNYGDKRDNFRERRDNFGEKRNYGERRDNGERRNYGERRDNDGERRTYGDRRDNDGERRDWGEKKDFHQKREFRDNRGERGDRPPRSNFTPRDRADKSFGSDNDKRSERSFKSQDSRSSNAPYKSRGKFTQVEFKELPNPVSINTAFAEPAIDPNAQHEVSVTWIISPDSFYTQILSLQPKFLEMMHKIPEMYKGVKPYTDTIPVGASVLARYPDDGVLYRATVVSVQPFGKFIVQYIDFGNKFLVDARDIWQLDEQLMELPKMAVHCSLLGVAPIDGEWKANNEIDLCFNAPRYQCVFQECVEGVHKVSLWNNGASVVDLLVEKQLATVADYGSSVTLKDEPIDLSIIVRQQMICRVTHVESFEKFYVQLDLEKAELVENAIANYDITLLTPLDAESLMDGVHCTVKHEDKVYRAILLDVSDVTSIKAVLPDYGMSITTTLENLMILPTDLSTYYYQCMTCCLNNYTEESNKLLSLEEFKTLLTNQKFIIYINDVDEITLVSTLYNIVTGKKVAIFEPDEGAYDEVTTLCTRAVFNYNFGMAYISHMENLNELYLQKSSDGDKIATLLDELYKFYEEDTPDALTNFEPENVCAAKSSDGNWYRATITSSTETHCKVQFPDYGNSEEIAKDLLKQLDPKFFEPCALSLVVGLGLVSLQEDSLAKLKDWTDEKEVQVTLGFGSDGWLASLHLDGVDLSMKLVNESLATPQIALTEETQEVPAAETVTLPEGCTQVYISHIDSPGQFWLQMADQVDKIEEIQAELQEKANTYDELDARDLGTLCTAKYSADDQWYRAEILDADSDIITVRFIDYGNTDVLDNQPGMLKVLPDHLKKIESYVTKASVNAVPTGTGQWSEPASDYFTQLVGDLSNPVDALVILKDVTTYVDIFVNSQNLTDKLVSEGHATKSEETECGGGLPSCFASHVNSPSEFWIQLESATAELQTMENAMVDAENFPELTEKEEGVICAAKYPEDDAWYRAQIIVDGSEGTEVLFMDYGNASITTELRCLPDELKVKPALSRKCALQKPRDIKSWSRKSEVKFNELAAEGATIFNVQFIASGDISIVELYLEGNSVTEELVGLCEEQPLSERPTPVGQDLQSSGKICHANSLNEFYIHLDTSASDMCNVMERLIDASEFKIVDELKVGSLCAAFWAEDEQWYRARILEFCDVGSHVQFIDYGNKAKCEEFRQLPEDINTIEPLAKCCRLTMPENENSKQKFDTYVAENPTFQIEFLDTTKEPLLVRLSLDGEDLNNIINSDICGKLPNNQSLTEENMSEASKTLPDKTMYPDETIIEDGKLPKEESNEGVVDSETINTEDESKYEEIETSATDLNESLESNHTVIENDTYNIETLDGELAEATTVENTISPEQDDSVETLQRSNDTIKSPEKSMESLNSKSPECDDSKESINTDTGYTSNGEHEISPVVESLPVTPDKQSDSHSTDKMPVNESKVKDIVDDVINVVLESERRVNVSEVKDEHTEDSVNIVEIVSKSPLKDSDKPESHSDVNKTEIDTKAAD